MSVKSKSPRAADLLAQGWVYDGGKLDDVGECTSIYGCPRAGRWSHRFVAAFLCTQHAVSAMDDGRTADYARA